MEKHSGEYKETVQVLQPPNIQADVYAELVSPFNPVLM